MEQEQELRYRQQVQDGIQEQECLDYLKPILEDIRAETLSRLELPVQAIALQDNLLDCRAAIVGCRKVEDRIRNKIVAGKIAENNLKGGE
jgi:hypothetical protein